MNAMYFDSAVSLATTIEYPTSRGPIVNSAGIMLSLAKIPSDPLGVTTVTFSGVVPGTEIAVIDSNGNIVADVENCVANQQIALPFYQSGNSLNDVTFRLISLQYVDQDISFTLTPSNVTVPVQQRIDRNYLNP